MGQIYDRIDDKLAAWITAQPMFFVGTAPLDPAGHVNISPKGSMQTFRILGPHQIAYVDLVGSGIETHAHLRENGRIVVMFCAFAGPPKIVRLHGRGCPVFDPDPEFPDLLAGFDLDPDTHRLVRGVIVVEIERIADSCGYTVPRMTFERERDQLQRWGTDRERKGGDDWKAAYTTAKNARSIDGLPGLDPDGQDPPAPRRATTAVTSTRRP